MNNHLVQILGNLDGVLFPVECKDFIAFLPVVGLQVPGPRIRGGGAW